MRDIRGERVAVVGGAGFLGSHLVNHLIDDRKCFVHVIDNLEVGRRAFVHPRAKFVYADICSSESFLERLFRLERIRYVFNYAARPYVPDSYARPLRTFDVNLMGACQVINAAWEAGCEAILQVSSAEVYGVGYRMGEFDNPEHVPLKLAEDCPIDAVSTYGASKAAIDAWVQCRWKEARTPCIALRQFNCIGERETHPYIVPEIISQLSEQRGKCRDEDQDWTRNFQGTVRLGNNTSRDFLYAGDAVRLTVCLLERGTFGEVYNLGSEESIKMYDLAMLIGKEMGFWQVTIERDEARVRPWDIWHLQSDNTKLFDAVYSPRAEPTVERTPLPEALRRTIKWYEENGRKWPWEV